MKKLFLLVLTLQTVLLSVFAQLKVQNLLTENLSNPIGIDVQQPRFSWQLTSDKRNTLQTAYEIKVSSGKKSVWTTGKLPLINLFMYLITELRYNPEQNINGR